MTNTTSSQSPVSGIVCGKCSSGFGQQRVVLRHADVAAVRDCFAQISVPAAVPPAPQTFARWFARCTQKGCTRTHVADRPFTFQCPAHLWVRRIAKQLVGQVSSADNHKCDSRCMSAVGPTCVCACGGVNHGISLVVSFTGGV